MSRSIYPTLQYEDAPRAVEFLVNAFGFEKVMVVPGDGDTIAHAELRFGAGMVMLGSTRDDASGVRSPSQLGGSVFGPYVVVENPDEHYNRAKAAGAEIVYELKNEEYGSRGYSARDPGGYLWSFGTYQPAHEEAAEA